VSRILASALFAATMALLAIAVVLAVRAQRSGFDVKGGYWTSEFLLVGLGGTAALLTAGVGLVIALNDPRNAIAWIFLGGSVFLAANLASNGYGDWTVYGGKTWPGSAWAAALGNWSFIPAVFVAPALVAQLFPNGRTLGGRWRWVFWTTVAVGAEATFWALVHPGPTSTFAERSNPLGAPRGARQRRHVGGQPRWARGRPCLRGGTRLAPAQVQTVSGDRAAAAEAARVCRRGAGRRLRRLVHVGAARRRGVRQQRDLRHGLHFTHADPDRRRRRH
jgi:hypothetical protein